MDERVAAHTDTYDSLRHQIAELESRLVAKDLDVEKASEELDRFTYIASHDLRAPLRALMTIPEWIRETLAERYQEVVEEVEVDLREMEVQTARMDSLLSSLLIYSRIGRAYGTPEHINPNDAITSWLQDNELSAGFVTSVAPCPPVTCAPQEFSLLIGHLIGNAIRHHDRSQGQIDIRARRLGDLVEFEVQDDGPGIEYQFAERVFELFSTLRPRDELEGDGMGLAHVRKIVGNLGCTVCLADKQGNRGTTIRFTLPASDEGRV